MSTYTCALLFLPALSPDLPGRRRATHLRGNLSREPSTTTPRPRVDPSPWLSGSGSSRDDVTSESTYMTFSESPNDRVRHRSVAVRRGVEEGLGSQGTGGVFVVMSQFWPLTVVVVTQPKMCMNLPETVTESVVL